MQISQINAQSWQTKTIIDLKEQVSAISINERGQLYAATNRGNLYCYDSVGNEISLNSISTNFPVSHVNTQNRLKVFVFSQISQQFYFLDRFSTTPQKSEIKDFQNELATLCTTGSDNSLWILCSAYNELRKYNLNTRQLILNTPLSNNLSKATHFEFYDNSIIISDYNEGIFFYDQQGNEQWHVSIRGVEHFQVYQNSLVFVNQGKIWEIDLKSKTTTSQINLPTSQIKKALKISDSIFYILEKNAIKVYAYQN